MKLRSVLKCLTSPTCAECSAGQLLSRSLWVAAKNRHEPNRSVPTFSKRTFSTDSGETIIQSSRLRVDLPEISLSDFMFSRFEKFGNKPALVSILFASCICKQIASEGEYTCKTDMKVGPIAKPTNDNALFCRNTGPTFLKEILLSCKFKG